VSDTGIGMDRNTREHIFEPFFTTKEVGKGTGLGLSMAYGIVKQHSGAIQVYSEPGLGTTFKIYLPLREQPADNRGRQARAPLPRGSETILLVEDDEAVREITRIMLEEFGYTVMEAGDGETALALFREHGDRIQLVLTDVIMPKMDGKSLIQEIQRIRPDAKALFMSGYTADIINEQWLIDPGMNYISKPLNPDLLLGKIRSILTPHAETIQ
jgi:CheY-like chemotaxis protein